MKIAWRSVAVIALLTAACATSRNVDTSPDAHGTFSVVLLGTGTPTPDPERSGSSVAVIAGDTAYLVDAGPGVVRRAAAGARQGHAPLEVKRLRYLFLTHLHSDHTLGVPDLLLTGWIEDRESPLEIYGPPGTRAMVENLLAAFKDDIEVRLGGWEAGTPRDGFRANVHEIQAGPIYRDENVAVSAFEVPHVNWKHAFGYRFDRAGRSVVISGDTGPSNGIVRACAGCDVLVHGVYSAEGIASGPAAWQRYFGAAHTSTAELGAVAADAKPRLLVLYHQMYWGKTDAGLVSEIRRVWPGNVVSARDLQVFTIR